MGIYRVNQLAVRTTLKKGHALMVPDYCEVLTGYRVWRVAEGGLLTGVHICEPWIPKQAHRASCQKKYGSQWSMGWSYGDDRANPHLVKGAYVPTPAFGCTCGVWAKRTEQNLHAAAEAFDAEKEKGWAWGTVSLWGHLVEHTQGWRAEFAYPMALKATSDAKQITALYGVPCETVKLKKRDKNADFDMSWGQTFYFTPMYTPVFSPPTPPPPSYIVSATPDQVEEELSDIKKRKREEQLRWRTFLRNHRGIKRAKAHVYNGPVTLARSF